MEPVQAAPLVSGGGPVRAPGRLPDLGCIGGAGEATAEVEVTEVAVGGDAVSVGVVDDEAEVRLRPPPRRRSGP